MKRNESARNLLEINIRAFQKLQASLPGHLDGCIDAIIDRIRDGHKVIVTGVGKSFHIAGKIAATMTSTGTPAFVLHPAEAMHGDLGQLQPRDVLLALSYSGETEELLTLLPFANHLDCLIVSITGVLDSSLALASNHVLGVTIEEEACPFNLAPTTSALVTLAMGDILASLLHESMGFTEEDYARLHPGGAIGNAIYLKISDIMRHDERLASLPPSASVKDAMFSMTKLRAGAVGIIDDARQVVGIVTDGDIRRHLLEHDNAMDSPVEGMMTANPVQLEQNQRAIELVKLFETRNINDVVIVDENGALVGMVDLQDMPKFKLL